MYATHRRLLYFSPLHQSITPVTEYTLQKSCNVALLTIGYSKPPMEIRDLRCIGLNESIVSFSNWISWIDQASRS